jgi:hypothetical protein
LLLRQMLNLCSWAVCHARLLVLIGMLHWVLTRLVRHEKVWL